MKVSSTTKNLLITLFITSFSLQIVGQEKKEYKIRDNGKDSVQLSILGKNTSGFYTGQYIKRLNGDKGCHPHGRGMFKFLYGNDTAYYEGDFFETNITGSGFIKTKSFEYRGFLLEGQPNGNGRLLNFSSNINNIKDADGNFINGKINGQASISYFNNNYYKGEVLENQRHGYGKIIYADGSIKNGKKGNSVHSYPFYEGNWVNDKQSGVGTMFYMNGESLNGNWNNQLFTGKGKLTFEDGSMYSGDWKEGIFNGEGYYLWSSGCFYQGFFQSGQMSGKGKFTYTDGSFCDGMWQYGKQNGYGVRFNKHNETYWNCNWKDNLPVDTGRVYSVQKQKSFNYSGGLSGKLENNSLSFYFHGLGKYNSKTFVKEGDQLEVLIDSVYIGNYEFGLMNGKGKLEVNGFYLGENRIPDEEPHTGSTYDGDWVKGNRQGNGDYKFNAEDLFETYTGEWRNNTKHGKGILKLQHQMGNAEYRGSWLNDNEEGYFEVITNENNPMTDKIEKSIFKGNYKNSKRNGLGTEVTDEGTYTGNWEDDLKSGHGKMVYKTGKIYDGEWEKDEPMNKTGVAQNKIETNADKSNTNVTNTPSIESVKIGAQVWMTKNLDVSTFRNGDPIPQAKTDEEWINAVAKKQAAWCHFQSDPDNGVKYGKLYNWYAVIDPRGIAPKGWHVPSDKEWTVLTDYLGGESEEVGTKMKSTNGWNNDGNGTNESGFNGLPGGCKHWDGGFGHIDASGFWWSSTQYDSYDAWFRELGCYNSAVYRTTLNKGDGFSVRCLRD